MKDLALDYYYAGYGCSQCILKAVEKKYGIRIDSKSYDMVGALNAGIGIGGMCAVLIASVMALGLLFDKETAKRHRITLLNEFHKKHGGLDCGRLIARRGSDSKCSVLICDAAEILDGIINTSGIR